MWFFVDESWSSNDYSPKFGVLSGVLIKDEDLEALDKFIFSIRKKYYGSTQAKNRDYELKGKDLLSKYIMKLYVANKKSLPRNICIVKELICFPGNKNFYLKVFSSTVFSATSTHPSLLPTDPRLLSKPFKSLIENVSMAASEDVPGRKVTLVFDQRIGAQKDIAIAIYNYVAGMKLPNIEIFPYFAVSNISPGVQFADILAYLLAKKEEKDPLSKRLIMQLYKDMKYLCWKSEKIPNQFGLNRFNEKIEGGVATYTIRK